MNLEVDARCFVLLDPLNAGAVESERVLSPPVSTNAVGSSSIAATCGIIEAASTHRPNARALYITLEHPTQLVHLTAIPVE